LAIGLERKFIKTVVASTKNNALPPDPLSKWSIYLNHGFVDLERGFLDERG